MYLQGKVRHYTFTTQKLPECRADFLIGDKRFTVEEPGVIHTANTPHAFVNIGDKSVTYFFPSSRLQSKLESGTEPLLA